MLETEKRELVPLSIAILTVSDTRDENTDRSGALLVQRLTEAGHYLYEKVIVKDDPQMISERVSQWIADDKADQWYFDTAEKVYRPDLYLAAANKLVEAGTIDH